MRLDLSKQRLMLSAAVAVLCASAAVPAALADTDVTTATTTPLTTTANGNITIESSGAISDKNGGAVDTLDSNNTITNNGVITKGDNDGSIGALIDTTDHNVVGTFTSSNTISVAGTGLGKNGGYVLGGLS